MYSAIESTETSICSMSVDIRPVAGARMAAISRHGNKHQASRRRVTSESTERANVHHSAYRVSTTLDWRFTNVAVQHRLGLLPKRRPRVGPCDCARAGFDGTGVIRCHRFQGEQEYGPDFCRFSGLDSTEAERRQASHDSFSPLAFMMGRNLEPRNKPLTSICTWWRQYGAFAMVIYDR